MQLKKPKFWDSKTISIWAIMLMPFSIFYQFSLWLINLFKPVKKFSIPIICVGNIYLGGTGKTPLSREIFKITKSLNKNPAFIKKSYSYLNDEIKMLKKTGKTFTSKDRVKSIFSCIAENHNIAILDDGYQEVSIRHNLSILCFNTKQLIGNGLTIPSGPLRENLKSIKRADCIFLNGEKNIDFENKIKFINNSAIIFYSKYKIKNLEKYENKKVIAFAGIGNPQNFFELLEENNIDTKKTFSYPDHYNFSNNDFDKLFSEISDDEILLTTEKDYYRINEKIRSRFEYVEINLDIENRNEFINLIKNRI